MYKIGQYATVIGLIMTIITAAGGFIVLFQDLDDLAKIFFGLTPVGFLILFVGFMTSILFEPKRESDHSNKL